MAGAGRDDRRVEGMRPRGDEVIGPVVFVRPWILALPSREGGSSLKVVC